VFLHNQKTVSFNDLSDETQLFFGKLSGYDTLRMILCKKAILVEGPSDELVVQKAYQNHNQGKLPIERGIDVISVGTSFLRFLEIAERIQKPLAIVTDNDGDINVLQTKFKRYLDDGCESPIKICFDSDVDNGAMEGFNYNTLEPKVVKVNDLKKMNAIFNASFQTEDDLLKYMKNNKTECALCIFDSNEQIKFPPYILDAIAD
jgi:putative ATP-dependent endonuclease of OLD family